MLDSHPHLAVPPESHFVVQGPGPAEDVAAALERIVAHHRFEDWGLAASLVRDEVARRGIDTYADLIDCLFGLFAHAQGKRRWGDKTPQHGFYVPQLVRLFPDAQFIHVIRDGREVAASIYDHRWTGSVITAADHWRRAVAAGRRWARLGPERYHELRLDRLIESPSQVLRELCMFLREPFAPEMLEYRRDARSRVPSRERERADHSNTEGPPTERLRDWTAGLSPRERIAIEALCASQLRELGMATSRPPLCGYLVAINHVLRARIAELLHPDWRPESLSPPTANEERSSARAAG